MWQRNRSKRRSAMAGIIKDMLKFGDRFWLGCTMPSWEQSIFIITLFRSTSSERSHGGSIRTFVITPSWVVCSIYETCIKAVQDNFTRKAYETQIIHQSSVWHPGQSWKAAKTTTNLRAYSSLKGKIKGSCEITRERHAEGLCWQLSCILLVANEL